MMIMITKEHLKRVVDSAKTETRDALQTVYNELNNGQRKKLVKSDEVRALFDRFGVAYDT